MLQQKYSDIPKETERKQSQQNQTENKPENNWDKSKSLRKRSIEKKVLIVVPKQPKFLIQRLPCKKTLQKTIIQLIRHQMSEQEV